MAAPLPNLVAKRYPADELLQMRNSLPVVNCVVAKLNTHPDIAAILRIPDQALNNPERYSCKSESLIEVIGRRKATYLGKKHVSATLSDESEEQVIVPTTQSTQHVQWNLRQRDSSDHSSQPHSAPPGAAAQQSENFQRFYRAVVSPTHVRVTAGGRIVPNTRITVPPQFEWNSEKLIFEPRKQLTDTEAKQLQASPLLQTPALSPGFPHLLPAGFLPSYNYHSQQNSPLTAMATQNLGSLGSNAETHAQNGQSILPGGDSVVGSLPQPQPIKISPPSQFDHSKPFVFNGHLVYPVPPGHQPPPHALPFPVNMIGNPNLAHSAPPPGGFFLPQPPMSLGHLPHPVMMHTLGQSSVPPVPSPPHPMEDTPPPAPYPSLPGVMSVAELTKFQIQGFRNHLKFVENQIANNKHQIDENYMENQRAEVLATIEKMEAMLKIQLAHEGKHDTGAYLQSAAKSSLQSQPVEGSGKYNSCETEGNSSPAMSYIAYKAPVVPQPTMQALKSEGIQGGDGTSDTKATIRLEPPTRSRLTAAAAMAPPFKPRTRAMVANNSFSKPDPSAVTNPTRSDSSSHTDGRITSYSSTTITGTGHVNLPRAHTIHGPSTHARRESLQGIFPQSQEVKEQLTTASNDLTIPAIPPNAVPYMIGTLPQGLHGNEAQATDLLYPRPLTNEEIRARYLYWGKAPRSAYSGLPKFDGKDFYPPSPTKGVARVASYSPGTVSDAKDISTPVKLEFEKLFIDSATASRKTPPSRPKQEQQFRSPSPTQVFLDNGIIGFRSPSPRPSTYKYEASTLLGRSESYQAVSPSKYVLAIQPDHDASTTPAPDFSNLFLERGVPGYKSPSPPRPSESKSTPGINKGKDGMVATTGNVGNNGEDHDTESLDSWGAPTHKSRGALDQANRIASSDSHNEGGSSASTVEFRLTPKIKGGSPKCDHRASSTGRTTNLSSPDQRNVFLQHMLKNTAQAAMAAPALGTVSSATAQGYLPQYRGSAAASLAPAMFSSPAPERDAERQARRPEHPNLSLEGVAPLIAANFLPENRPLNRDRSPRPIRASRSTLGAEGYMRYLAQKADEDRRIIEQGWNANTTATGPVMGSDW